MTDPWSFDGNQTITFTGTLSKETAPSIAFLFGTGSGNNGVFGDASTKLKGNCTGPSTYTFNSTQYPQYNTITINWPHPYRPNDPTQSCDGGCAYNADPAKGSSSGCQNWDSCIPGNDNMFRDAPGQPGSCAPPLIVYGSGTFMYNKNLVITLS